MEKVKRTFFTAKNITYLAVFAALIIILQLCSGFIAISTTRMSFVLVPIVLGGMLMGVGVGTILGLLFGIIVIVTAVVGLDAFTLYMLNDSPVFTVFLCLLKGVAAGFIPAVLYKLIAKKNKYVAVFIAAICAPIVNTGIFVAGAFIISNTIVDAMSSIGYDVMGLSASYIIIVGCAGVNFLVELAINIICSPALYTVNRVILKQLSNRKYKKYSTNDKP